MKVAILGPEGTYTHQAAEDYFEDYETVFCPTIREAIYHDSDATVVPFENSLEGGVMESVDLFKKEDDINIIGEKVLSISHFLVSKEENLEEVEMVKSHPQALAQCRDFISNHGWKIKETASTSKAASNLGRKEAAIAPRITAELNDLNILKEDIQGNNTNETRFFILGHNGKTPEKREKTSMILDPGEDRPGLLADILSCFSENGINLSYIQSRPTKKELGKYFFFVDVETDTRSEEFKSTVKCLDNYSDVKVLGSYKADK